MKVLLDLKTQRTFKQALIFYFAWAIVFLIFSAALLIERFIPDVNLTLINFNLSLETISTLIVSIVCMSLSFFIAYTKKILKNPQVIALIFISLILSVWGNVPFGLLIPAHLTTKKSL